MITITNSLSKRQKDEIWEILKTADNEFVPPLSSRYDTVQRDFADFGSTMIPEPTKYFEALLGQSFLLYMENGHIKGFISFIDGYSSDLTECPVCIYISTIIVIPSERQKGITQKMYSHLFNARKNIPVLIRTWSENRSHIHILQKLGFNLLKRIPNDRGEGIDTVYFMRGVKDNE